MNANNQAVLKALFSIKRDQILLAKLNPATEEFYSSTLAYAVDHSIYPYLDLHDWEAEFSVTEKELSPFHDAFEIPAATVYEIFQLIAKGESLTFGELERSYREGDRHWPGGYLASGIACVCRYIYMSSLEGSVPFWKTFLEDAPHHFATAIQTSEPFVPIGLKNPL